MSKRRFVVEDRSATRWRKLPVVVRQLDDGALAIQPKGYGDASSVDGHGCPIVLDFWEGKLRVVVFPSINSAEPSIIALEGAAENLRTMMVGSKLLMLGKT